MRCSCGEENFSYARRCCRCGAPLGSTRRWLRWCGDGLLAASLLIALALIFLLDRRWGGSSAILSNLDENPQVAEQTHAPITPLRLAVTPPEFDDMGKLLESLGPGYRYELLSMEDLLDPANLRRYDVLFLTCGCVPNEWLKGQLRQSARQGIRFGTLRADVRERLQAALRGFVEAGGTLYASDWRFGLVEIAFPEFSDSAAVQPGAVQAVTADVLAPELQRRLGRTIELHFDKPAWQPAAFRGEAVSVLLTGRYKSTAGRQVEAPLMVQFPCGKGIVIFTAFHNEKQPTAIEQELLRTVVFATVTARTTHEAEHTLLRGGFATTERNLLTASGKDQAVTQTYHCRGGCTLRFVLAFEPQGAELKLTVLSPDGQRTEKSGGATFAIEIPQAMAGRWSCTIIPHKVPYENFPFTLTVAEKRE